jgi:phage tail-like protein
MTVYPLTGFHFLVQFELSPTQDGDTRFQEVTGLSVDVNLDTYNEGGENRFIHRLPGRSKSSDLILKRGLTTNSGLTAWCADALQNFNYQPTNLTVSLLDETHQPVLSWYVVNAFPIKWEIGGFNAEQSQIVIETITLRYEYYKNLNLPPSLTGIAADTASAISASISIAML